MKRLILAVLTLPLALPAVAQTTNLSELVEIDDLDVVGIDGDQIGEVETVLVDRAGTPVALVVEIDDGFPDQGDRDVVIGLDVLSWQNGRYVTDMTSADVEALPRWDD